MDLFQSFAKILIILGIATALVGVIIYLSGRIGIGRLPGDIFIKKGSFMFYFPLVTCIIISLVLTLLFNLFRLFRK